MSGPDFPWEQIPDAAMEAFDERLRLVEMLLDPHLGNADKRAERRRYCEQHRVGERTIRGYLHRYRKKGPRGLLFYRPRPTSPRVHDPGLRAKLLALVNELPTRSVPQLRKLLATDDQLGSKIKRISDRTIYRFLAEQGLTQAVRYRMLAEDSRSSFLRGTALPGPPAGRGHLARHPPRPQENLPVPLDTTSPAKSCSASTISTRSCPP